MAETQQRRLDATPIKPPDSHEVELQTIPSRNADDVDLYERDLYEYFHKIQQSRPQESRQDSALAKRSVLFSIRISTLFLSVAVSVLSIAYCVSQDLSVELELIKECTPMAIEDIWHHSYLASLGADSEINKHSQHGLADEACYTTKTIATNINTEQLWYGNTFNPRWAEQRGYQFWLFLLTSIYGLIIVLYNVAALAVDVVDIAKRRLHTKSHRYRKYTQSMRKLNAKDHNKLTERTRWRIIKSRLFRVYFTYFASDTTGWIILKFLGEITELAIQTQALLMYNGYNEHGAYLALKPESIVFFAAIISFNLVGTGLLWFCYAILPKFCYGLLFKRLLFFIDNVSDILLSLPVHPKDISQKSNIF